jgi:hypothetical protein
VASSRHFGNLVSWNWALRSGRCDELCGLEWRHCVKLESKLRKLFTHDAERLSGCGDLLGLERGGAHAVEERGISVEKELGGHAEAVLIHWSARASSSHVSGNLQLQKAS